MLRIPLTFMLLGTILFIAGEHFSNIGLMLLGSFLLFSGGYYSLKTLNILYSRVRRDEIHL